MDNSGDDYPINFLGGWQSEVGTPGINPRPEQIYYSSEVREDEYGVPINMFNVWLDTNPDPLLYTNWFPGRGEYDARDRQVWADDGTWFTC